MRSDQGVFEFKNYVWYVWLYRFKDLFTWWLDQGVWFNLRDFRVCVPCNSIYTHCIERQLLSFFILFTILNKVSTLCIFWFLLWFERSPNRLKAARQMITIWVSESDAFSLVCVGFTVWLRISGFGFRELASLAASWGNN